MPHQASNQASNQNPVLAQARKQDAAVNNPSSTLPVVEATPVPVVDLAGLTDIQGALEANTALITSSIEQLRAGAQVTKSATDVITSSVRSAVSADQTIQITKDIADLEAQNSTIEAIGAAGTTDFQSALMETLNEDTARVRSFLDERADIIDDEHTGIQLIDGVINELRSFQTEAKIRTAQIQRNSTIREISAVTAASESFAKINTLTKKTTNEATIRANYARLEALGNIKGAEAEIAAVQTNAAAFASLVATDARGVANRVNAFRLEGEFEQREITREKMVLQREQMAVDREKLLIAIPAARVALESAQVALADAKDPKTIAAKAAQRDKVVKDLNDSIALEDQLTRAVQQGQALSGTAVEDKDTIIFGFTNPTSRDKYTALQERGGSSNQTIADNAYDAMVTMELIAPSGSGIESPALDALDEIKNKQLEKYAESIDGIPKDIATRKKDIIERSEEFMDTAAGQITTGDTSNPYHSVPMGVLTDKYKSIKDSTFFKRVIAPMAMKDMNPESIMGAAVAGIRSKTVTLDEAAAGIEVIFDAASTYNNTINGGYRRFGLPNQNNYNVLFKAPRTFVEKLKLGGLILVPPTLITPDLASDAAKAFRKDTQIVDLMNGTKVKNILVRFLATSSPTKKTTDTTDTGTEQ